MTSRRWLRAFRFWRRSPAAEVDAELRFHFDQRIAELEARGLTRDAAASQAESEFGDRRATREELVRIDERIATQHRRADWWDAVGQEFRYVIRSLRRTPAFSVMVVATLALGLGANTALISVLERLLWRPPAGVPAVGELRRVHTHYFDRRTHVPAVRSVFNYSEMRRMVEAKPSQTDLTGFRDGRARLGQNAQGSDVATVEVIGDYFGVLNLQPSAGRFFTADEARAETVTPLAVISHRLWVREFAGASTVIGQGLDLGPRHYTIVGVAPPSFQGLGLDATDVWIPMNATRRSYEGHTHWYEDTGTMFIHLVSRIHSENDERMFAAAATNVMHEVADSGSTVVLASVIEPVWPDGGSAELTMATRLAGVAGILLLIACANVANLLLARGVRRRREIAVRLALGISRSRLVTMLLMESVFLALMGGALGFVIGAIASSALRHALLPRVMWGDRMFELKVALFSMALAMTTGILAGLVPALRASRPELAGALKAGTREGGGQRSRLRNALIVAQAALSIVLVAAAGMFVVSLRRVQNIDIGYSANEVLIAQLTHAQGITPPNDLDVRVPDFAQRLRALPGVEAVGLVENAPFEGIGFMDLFRANREKIEGLSVQGPFVSHISGDFFTAPGMRVIRGRGIEVTDRKGSPGVLVVNETMAHAVWPGENAVGKCLILDEPTTPCREVVGVVSNANALGYIEDPAAQLYLPAQQDGHDQPSTIVVLTTRGRTAAVLPAVQQLMVEGFPGWGPPRIRTLATILAPKLQPRRLAASVYGAAGLLALIIAAIGIYSSVAYAVGQRMHEMGVRAALGARSTHIVGLVLGEGVRVVFAGIVLGIVLALALGKAIASLLYNTSTRDPVLLTSVSLALLVVAFVACFVPAWKATRANPVDALRAD